MCETAEQKGANAGICPLNAHLCFCLKIMLAKQADIVYNVLRTCRCDGIGRRSGLKIRRQRWHGGSSPPTGTNLNDPTKSEQIVVSYSDRAGSFFACSPCVSMATASLALNAMCHWPDTNSPKSRYKTCKGKNLNPH